MTFKRKPLAVAMMVSAIMTTGVNQSSAQDLKPIDEITVTGSKMDRSFGDLTQSVSIIGEAELDKMGYTTLTEVLRNEPGLELQFGL